MSSNIPIRLTSAYEITEHWTFFRQGMKELNDPRRAGANYTEEEFFNMLTRVTLMGDKGLVLMLTSKNHKPLGFGCGFHATDFNFKECFYVWAAYSTGRCRTTLSELLSYCEEFAQALDLTTIKTATPRLTGAADRLFENALGFRREFFTYTKSI